MGHPLAPIGTHGSARVDSHKISLASSPQSQYKAGEALTFHAVTFRSLNNGVVTTSLQPG